MYRRKIRGMRQNVSPQAVIMNDTVHLVHTQLPTGGGFALCGRLQTKLGHDISVLVQVSYNGKLHTIIQRKGTPFDVAELMQDLQCDIQIERIWTTDVKEAPPNVGRICELYQLYDGTFARTEFHIRPIRMSRL